jgi:2-amino-4-hydroxy-6-hydroxymethyldihydropteridine diphosphokinase
MSAVAYIGFGSNQGDREQIFYEALDALKKVAGILVKRSSSLYETAPIGIVDGGGPFLNGAIEVETDLSPLELLEALKGIELRLGKAAGHKSDQSRIIDLDLLLFGSSVVREADLEIPHPRMSKRAFVLVPLSEIASQAFHPTAGCTVGDLVGRLPRTELLGIRLWKRMAQREA